MDIASVLGAIANLAQIVSVVWLLVFGGRSIKEVQNARIVAAGTQSLPVSSRKKRNHFLTTIVASLLALVLSSLIALLLNGSVLPGIHGKENISISTPTLKWVFSTADGVVSSPRMVDGVVYVGSTDDKVYAIDASTGQTKWTFPTGSYVYSSPTVVDGVVYVGSGDNKVYAIDTNTGEKKWAFPTGAPVESSPTVVNGVLYVGSWDHKVYALTLPGSSS